MASITYGTTLAAVSMTVLTFGFLSSSLSVLSFTILPISVVMFGITSVMPDAFDFWSTFFVSYLFYFSYF
jgi:hypothetical protein